MKLVTFDDGKVGWVDGDVVHQWDVPSMRDVFEAEGTPRVIAEFTPITRPHGSSSGPPELPRAILAVWSSTCTPDIIRRPEKFPSDRIGDNGWI